MRELCTEHETCTAHEIGMDRRLTNTMVRKLFFLRAVQLQTCICKSQTHNIIHSELEKKYAQKAIKKNKEKHKEDRTNIINIERYLKKYIYSSCKH